MLVIAGDRLNHLTTALSITASGAAHSLFGTTYVANGWPADEFRFAAAGVDDRLTADLALWDGVIAAGFGSGTPTGYVEANSGTGSCIETTVGGEVRTGSAVKVSGGATPATGLFYRSQPVRSGQKIRFRPWIRGDNTANGIARVRVFNPHTGNYLQSGGASWGAVADVFTRQTNTYAEQDVTFTVESFRTCGDKDIVNVQFQFLCTGTGNAFFDDLYAWPTTDWASIHGHNLAGVIAVQVRQSSDNFGANDVLNQTLTKRRVAFGAKLTSEITDRYIQFRFVGTNTEAIAIGEAVLSKALTIVKGPGFPVKIKNAEAQVEGDRGVSQIRRHPRRLMEIGFRQGTAAQYQEFAEEVQIRCRGKLFPIVIQYDQTSDGEVVMHGRLESEWSSNRTFLSTWENSLAVVENPFGTRTA